MTNKNYVHGRTVNPISACLDAVQAAPAMPPRKPVVEHEDCTNNAVADAGDRTLARHWL
jgi:hypothetical protein